MKSSYNDGLIYIEDPVDSEKMFLSLGYEMRNTIEIKSILDKLYIYGRKYSSEWYPVSNNVKYKNISTRNTKIYKEAKALEKLSKCSSIVFFVDDYYNYYNVQMEVVTALQYGLKLIPLTTKNGEVELYNNFGKNSCKKLLKREEKK